MVTKEELIERIEICESEEQFTIHCSDDSEYEVGYADCWIGGEGMDGWGCDALGNVLYSSPESLATALVDFFAEDEITIEEME